MMIFHDFLCVSIYRKTCVICENKQHCYALVKPNKYIILSCRQWHNCCLDSMIGVTFSKYLFGLANT